MSQLLSLNLCLATQYCDGLRGPMVVYDHEGDPHRELCVIYINTVFLSIQQLIFVYCRYEIDDG